MSIETNSVPVWYNKEEAECFEKVKALAKRIPSAMVDPEESHVVIECVKALSTDEILCISDFNKECPELLVSYAYESDHTKGKRYPLQ